MNRIKTDNNQSKLINIVRELITERQSVDYKLFSMKSKVGAKNYIYNSVKSLITGFFTDTAWENVMKVHDKLSELGVDLTWGVKDGGYAQDGMSKTYDFTIEYVNIDGKTFKFIGHLICSFCGTVDDPMSKYDITFLID